jgi:hypothetical protein
MDYQMVPPAKKTRPIVLHGKVLHLIDDSDEMEDSRGRAQKERTVSRQVAQTAEQTAFERRSAFAKLTHETQAFQKLVGNLEEILEQSSESPEASWRARIIIRSAQEAEKNLWNKLSKYEQSPLTAGKNIGSGISGSLADKDEETESSQRELRTAQTACMKLHRDFNRSHKIFGMILSLHQKRQKEAEVNGVRAVRWSHDKETATTGTTTQDLNKKDEDYSDRAMRRVMREREANLERKSKSKSVNQVNEVYHDMGAASVDGQQSNLDLLDDNVLDDSATIQSGGDEFNCLFDRDRFCGAMNFTDDFTERDGEEKQPFSPSNIEKSEVFDWRMPFENIGEDMKSVHRDIVRMGKDIIQKGGEYRRKSKSSKA